MVRRLMITASIFLFLFPAAVVKSDVINPFFYILTGSWIWLAVVYVLKEENINVFSLLSLATPQEEIERRLCIFSLLFSACSLSVEIIEPFYYVAILLVSAVLLFIPLLFENLISGFHLNVSFCSVLFYDIFTSFAPFFSSLSDFVLMGSDATIIRNHEMSFETFSLFVFMYFSLM